MKFAAFTAMTIVAVAAPVVEAQPETKVAVYVTQHGYIPRDVRIQAQAKAYQMFAQAGVRVDWRDGKAPADASPLTLTIDLKTNTPRTFLPGSLAHARPYGNPYIEIFYDRLAEVQAVRSLLAHVMVHEITHILQGGDWHSETGVMKATWSKEEQAEMGFRPLPFTPRDIDLIRRGIEWRVKKNIAGK